MSNFWFKAPKKLCLHQYFFIIYIHDTKTAVTNISFTYPYQGHRFRAYPSYHRRNRRGTPRKGNTDRIRPTNCRPSSCGRKRKPSCCEARRLRLSASVIIYDKYNFCLQTRFTCPSVRPAYTVFPMIKRK